MWPSRKETEVKRRGHPAVYVALKKRDRGKEEGPPSSVCGPQEKRQR